MLRITALHGPESLLLKLEGSLRGPWVSELQKAWLQSGGDGNVQVDLSGVSFADSKGRDVLAGMEKQGAVLVGASAFMRQILSETQDAASGQEPGRKEN
jgi:anti-anti-sigma regulatory factor